MPDKISLEDKFSQFSERWRPKVIAAPNGQEVKLVKVEGTFPWHHHDNAAEFFLVWKGRFAVEFRDRIVWMGPGEGLMVPRGVEHRTLAEEEAEILIFEPAATRNTGNVEDATFTAPGGERI